MKTARLVLAAALCALALCTNLFAAETDYSDVPAEHWAWESIHKATEAGLVQGTGGGRFGLGQEITRASYAAMLCRLMGWEEVTPPYGSFTDNRDNAKWYYAAIETAWANGALFVQGTECYPDEVIDREEMAASLVRALGYQTLSGLAQDECPFEDVTVNRGYIALAFRMGLVNGTKEGVFSPHGRCTREQAATVLVRAWERLHREPVKLTPAPEHAVFAQALEGTAGPVPASPRAGLESVCTAALEAGEDGCVAVHTAPFSQRVGADGSVSAGENLTQEELEALLSDPNTAVYRSERYESSYLILPARDGTATVVWFESAEDLAEKVRLCALLGVGSVCFVP